MPTILLIGKYAAGKGFRRTEKSLIFNTIKFTGNYFRRTNPVCRPKGRLKTKRILLK